MRLAGTWSRYSKNAMPQLTTAARYHEVVFRCFRWPYQASVMKRLDATSNVTVIAMACAEVMADSTTRPCKLIPPRGCQTRRHGPSPHHFPHRPAARDRAHRARPAPRDRALVSQPVAGTRGQLLRVRGPAQQRLQAGPGGHESLPGRLQQPQSRVPAAVRARRDVRGLARM